MVRKELGPEGRLEEKSAAVYWLFCPDPSFPQLVSALQKRSFSKSSPKRLCSGLPKTLVSLGSFFTDHLTSSSDS